MEQLVDGQHVRLRSTELGMYLHADEDGHGVSLQNRRESVNSAWAVQLHNWDDDAQHVLLYGAAYGRYLAATDTPAPVGRGIRVEQRNYDHPETNAILWRVFRMPGREGVHLRSLNGGVLGHYSGNGVSAEDTPSITMMMNWIVETIPAMGIPPGLPAEVPLPDAISTSRVIEYVWRNGHGAINSEGWFMFDGRSVFRLRSELAGWLAIMADTDVRHVPDVAMCLPSRGGRIFPIVVDLPISDQTVRIVVVIAGSPAHMALRYADVDAE